MAALLATALGLGVAGVDPAGALLAIAALTRGVAGRAVLAFAAVVVLGTVALGTTLSLTVGQRLADVEWDELGLPGGDTAAVVELAIAAALLVWVGRRLRRPEARPKPPTHVRGAGVARMLGLGGLFAASAAIDPTFVGLVVVAGRDEPALGVALAHLLWITVSQVPLLVVAGAVALGAHHRAVTTFERLRRRMAPAARIALTAVLALGGLVLGADALAQLGTGDFLL